MDSPEPWRGFLVEGLARMRVFARVREDRRPLAAVSQFGRRSPMAESMGGLGEMKKCVAVTLALATLYLNGCAPFSMRGYEEGQKLGSILPYEQMR